MWDCSIICVRWFLTVPQRVADDFLLYSNSRPTQITQRSCTARSPALRSLVISNLPLFLASEGKLLCGSHVYAVSRRKLHSRIARGCSETHWQTLSEGAKERWKTGRESGRQTSRGAAEPAHRWSPLAPGFANMIAHDLFNA